MQGFEFGVGDGGLDQGLDGFVVDIVLERLEACFQAWLLDGHEADFPRLAIADIVLAGAELAGPFVAAPARKQHMPVRLADEPAADGEVLFRHRPLRMVQGAGIGPDFDNLVSRRLFVLCPRAAVVFRGLQGQ